MTTSPASTGPVLLTGGTGATGRRAAALLRARAVPVRTASRTGLPPFSWQDRATWSTQVRGARAEHVDELRAAGVDEDVVQLMDHLFAEVLDGRDSAPRDGVQEALGRPPRDVTAHLPAAAGSWAETS